MQTQGFRGQFTTIKGLSDRRRLPRLGKIRLGIKVQSKRTGNVHPKEVDYFVVPPEVAKIYGEHPKELDVLLPVNDPGVVFPQKYTLYGRSKGPKCMGNGEIAQRVNEETKEFENVECPCELLEKGECNRIAHLMVILPKISVAGVYQIDTGSSNSITDINSGLDYIEALVGRFAMVPCKLKRTPRETHGSGRKETHYTLQIFLDEPEENRVGFLNFLRENTNRILGGKQYALPAPEEVNPVMDDAPIQVIDEEEAFEEQSEEGKSEEEKMVEEVFGEAEPEPEEKPKPEPPKQKNGPMDYKKALENARTVDELSDIFNGFPPKVKEAYFKTMTEMKKSLANGKRTITRKPPEEDIPEGEQVYYNLKSQVEQIVFDPEDDSSIKDAMKECHRLSEELVKNGETIEPENYQELEKMINEKFQALKGAKE